MDEVTKAKMALHKELKLKISNELAKNNFATMQKEAKEIFSLTSLVKKLQKSSVDNGFDSVDINELSLAIEKMRDSIICRWIIIGVSMREIASVFKLPTAKVSQIKKQIAQTERSRTEKFL